MSADIAHELHSRTKGRARSLRVRAVLALGPLTSAAGVLWAVVQPWRLTLLHPQGQGFWWLFSEPPLYVVLVGLLFRFVIARGIVADLEAER
jgi:hypothetical protein